jgi:tRNA A37 methylthiotransferase MiaB
VALLNLPRRIQLDALLEANSLKGHGITRAVVAVGCMAERYGNELADALPEADAILGFDDYKEISARLQSHCCRAISYRSCSS